MDTLEGLYSFFGTSDPAMLALDLVVAVIFSIAIVYLLLELLRIYKEYSRKVPAQAYEKPHEKAEEKPVVPVAKPEAKVEPKPEPKVEPRPAEKIPEIDVLKATLADSMKSITEKYNLESITLATQDGLVIASTSGSADQDAAVYSGLFHELFKVKQEPYYFIESKDVNLYYVDSSSVKVVGVARRRGALSSEEQKIIRDDTKKIVDKFASGKK